ncbi:flagellar hook-associated protein 1 FlgK [Paramicrobacterium humi]|uniref:Flagellar hook-associated protein 1 n=1 Tax=Paramicrobacterium humi TaxID=640635 RepID=A0A1H4N5X2_9MICO|nr:flagellar hook-associated protein FlgK [Microbacterium humi]SEB90689.1 flagellar hook-associated protein 1 FlgK [Microbacterium humi]
MSTFSGLNTAYTAIAAARIGIDVTGQNIANQGSEGYTRQRVTTSALDSAAMAGKFSMGVQPGRGVSVDGIARLGNDLLDARVRDTLAASGFWATKATASLTAEGAMAEPGKNGLSSQLSQFWAGWQDLANNPDSDAAAAVILNQAQVLAAQISAGYQSVADQWQSTRVDVNGMTSRVNSAADQIAALNGQIRSALNSGRSANELIDQRNLLAQNVSRLAGATASLESDGTLTVRVGGNALVDGVTARHLVASGPRDLAEGGRVSLAWESRPDLPITLAGGELGGALAVLAPASEGGTLAQVAESYNEVATELARQVNAVHGAGVTADNNPGGDFFALSAEDGPAALGLTVIPQSRAQLALALPDAGALDGGNADLVSQIGQAEGSPDAIWASFVTRFGVATAGDAQRANLAETASVTAVTAQQSVASVDGDEETVNLLTYQTAYQAAARVLTAVDESLDVLINKTGLVGR